MSKGNEPSGSKNSVNDGKTAKSKVTSIWLERKTTIVSSIVGVVALIFGGVVGVSVDFGRAIANINVLERDITMVREGIETIKLDVQTQIGGVREEIRQVGDRSDGHLQGQIERWEASLRRDLLDDYDNLNDSLASIEVDIADFRDNFYIRLEDQHYRHVQLWHSRVALDADILEGRSFSSLENFFQVVKGTSQSADIFQEWYEVANLYEQIGPAEKTYFVFTDAAVEELNNAGFAEITNQPRILIDLIKNHIVDGIISSDVWINEQEYSVSTEVGSIITITRSAYGGSQFVATDIKIPNGYVHLIDAVQFPLL